MGNTKSLINTQHAGNTKSFSNIVPNEASNNAQSLFDLSFLSMDSIVRDAVQRIPSQTQTNAAARPVFEEGNTLNQEIYSVDKDRICGGSGSVGDGFGTIPNEAFDKESAVNGDIVVSQMSAARRVVPVFKTKVVSRSQAGAGGPVQQDPPSRGEVQCPQFKSIVVRRQKTISADLISKSNVSFILIVTQEKCHSRKVVIYFDNAFFIVYDKFYNNTHLAG